MRWSIERTTNAGIVCSFLILFAAAAAAYRAVNSFQETREQVLKTQNVLVKLEAVSSSMRAVEAAGRGFVITGDAAFLNHYELEKKELAHAWAEMRALIGTDVVQRERMDRIDRLLVLRVEDMNRNIQLRRSEGLTAAAERVALGQGLRLMEEIRREIDSMQDEESRMLERQIEVARVQGRRTFMVLGTGLGLNFLLVGLAGYFRHRDLEANRLTVHAKAYAESIVETVPMPLLIVGGDLRISSANRAYYELFKTTPEVTVDRPLIALEQGQWNFPALLDGLKKGTPPKEKVEFSAGWAGVGTRHLLLSWRGLPRIDRRPLMTLLAIEDVTESKQAMDALRKSQSSFQQLFEAAPDAMILVDGRGRLVRANPQTGVLFGYNREELAQLELSQLLPDRYRTKHAQHFAAFFAAPVTRPIGVGLELSAQRRDGSEFPVDILLSPADSEEGHHVLAVIRDITNRKRVEQMHLQFRALFESLPGLYAVLKPDFTIVGASDAYLEATMTTREAILGRNLFEVFPDNPDNDSESASQRMRDSLQHVLQTGAPDSLSITRHDIRRPDGTYEERYWSPVNSPVFGAEGKIEYLIHRVEDVTEFVRQKQSGPAPRDAEGLRKRMESMEAEIFARAREIEIVNQRLRSANDELEAFSYSISHDLRAPLRHIDGFADMLRQHVAAEADAVTLRYLDTITNSAKRMGRLIDDLLAFSRMGRHEMNRQNVKLDTLVAEARQSALGDAVARDIAWSIAPLPEVEGDEGMLRQVFTNLLSNAVKYTRQKAGARIEIGSMPADDPDHTVIFIRDNGAGFDMKYASKLFGVFQRLHSPREFEGTGVGLAIVRRIVQRHGGKVWAEGKIEEGATFYICLPVRAPTPAHAIL